MASRFWVGGTGTWTVNGTANWASASGGAAGASAPGSADTATFDTASGGGLVTVNGAVTVQSITMGAFANGTLDFSANNNDVTLSLAFDASGTQTRALSMGNGNWVVQGFNNNTWNLTTVANLAFNANLSTLSFIPSSAAPTGQINFVSGARTYNTVAHSGVTNAAAFQIAGGPTMGALQVTAPANIQFANGTTATITNAFSWAGSSTNQIYVTSDNTNASATVAAPANSTIQWAAIRRMTFTGNTVIATNSFDLRSNSGVTITVPATGSTGGGRIISG